MATRLWSVVIDCADPARLARWWSDVLGWPVTHEEPGECVVEPGPGHDPAGGIPSLVFGVVPEAKTGRNRIRLHLAGRSGADRRTIVEPLLGAGATRLDVDSGDEEGVVLADPEGNELCVLRPR
jgi:catechol 2,3-dioxygenase-like lactoylglutathione lyase family enzyme